MESKRDTSHMFLLMRYLINWVFGDLFNRKDLYFFFHFESLNFLTLKPACVVLQAGQATEPECLIAVNMAAGENCQV